MKTEDFDDAIRRKLESINNASTQHDVDSVHQYILSKKAKGFKRRAAFIILSATSILIIGALFTWNILQVKEINRLKQHIAQLDQNTKNRSTLHERDNSETTSGAERKSLAEKKDADTPTAYPSPAGAHKAADLTRSKNKINTLTKQAFSNREESHRVNTTNASTPPISMNNKISERFEKNKGQVTNEAHSSSTQIPKEKELEPLPESEDVIHTKMDTSATAANPADAQIISFRDTLKPTSSIKDSSVSYHDIDLPVYPKMWIYRAGLGLETGNFQFGAGILGEAVYKNRIAISAGIKLLKNGAEKFDDDDDYDDHKKKEFKQTYGNQVDEGPRNIKIRNTLVQIPLTLSYILPVKHNFSILAGLGTDIDVYTKQHIEYRHINVANDLQTSQFVTKYPPMYFNNIVITCGLQKKIHPIRIPGVAVL